MNDAEVRLECLKLAAQLGSADAVGLARELYALLSGGQ